MGEVYKAQDTRLHRAVALKVLPEDVAGDPDRRQRLEREARAVASLNHPRICSLHDVGSQDGVDFLVMEYLEGETLETRLTRGALPLDEALSRAVEIADALDRAHEAGIVHRDLKPGNVMLTPSGAKLLDFGIAKRRSDLGGESRPNESLTIDGTILGTPQYMAPEQLKGERVDRRTDIFALGVLLYEMLTGHKAFAGESPASVIASVLDSEPIALHVVLPDCPQSLEHVVQTCLAKNPADRWQSARDLRRQLQWMQSGDTPLAAVRARRGHWSERVSLKAAAIWPSARRLGPRPSHTSSRCLYRTMAPPGYASGWNRPSV